MREPAVVIVGAGAAGVACATALHERGHRGRVTLLGAEPSGPVDRRGLTKGALLLGTPLEPLPLPSGIELRADEPAVAFDVAARRVHLRGGLALPYEKLLLATGADARGLMVPGAALPHVRTLRSALDGELLAEQLRGARRAVVVGASFVALEAAASLRQRGLEVQLVAPDAVPLARLFGDVVGRFVQRLHERHGVVFNLEVTPIEIDATHVTLSDGRRLPADVIVVGVGIRPRLELARGAGLALEDGVLVDAQLRSSAPDVYAAGDIARVPLAHSADRARVDHWASAVRQGRAAALAMLGEPDGPGEVPTFSIELYDVTLRYIGWAPRWGALSIHGDLEARDATLVYRRAERVVAIATLGRDAEFARAEAAFLAGDAAALEALDAAR